MKTPIAALVVLICPMLALNGASAANLRTIFDSAPPSAQQSDYHAISCPTPPPPIRSIQATSFYKPGTDYTVIDKNRFSQNQKNIAPLKQFAASVTEQSDNYLASGRRNDAAAQCVMSLLDSWASASALTEDSNGQGAITIVFTLPGLTLDYLIVRNNRSIDPAVRARVVRWLEGLGKQADTFSARLRNNIAYWADASAMGAAIAANNQNLFNSALKKARQYGIDAIREDGSLPREVARRERAMGYHTVALNALSMIAEFAYANDINLYNEKGGRLRALIDLVTRNYNNPRDLERMTGEPQTWYPNEVGHLAWAEPSYYRFHNPQIGALLSKHRPVKEPNSGGNITLIYTTLPR